MESWERWYRASEPESSELPGEWDAKCNELQRMVLVRCLRYALLLMQCVAYMASGTLMLRAPHMLQWLVRVALPVRHAVCCNWQMDCLVGSMHTDNTGVQLS